MKGITGNVTSIVIVALGVALGMVVASYLPKKV